MAHPKRKTSKTRRDKRRTNIKSKPRAYTVDPATGEAHLRHRAYWSEGKLYYRGKVIREEEASS